MSSVTYVGRQVRDFDSSPQFSEYSRVIIVVSEETEYSAGTETGRTLTLNCPWGTQAMADDLLAKMRGYQYQPYTASDALLDPAAELGDAVTVNGVYGGIYTQETKFGPLWMSSISAPTEEEIDHEYPYVPRQERKVTRELRGLSSRLLVQAGLISAEVEERKSAVEELKALLSVEAGKITAEATARQEAVKQLEGALSEQADNIEKESADREKAVTELKATLSIQAEQISAKVSRTGGDSSSFGWDLDAESWSIKANGSEILRATKNGLEISGRITAISGRIGGFDIEPNYLSCNNQEWGGTNSRGIYIGPDGIQLGKNFKVDASGHLEAASGTFTGEVSARNIKYGGSYGTLPGGAISANSIGTGGLSRGVNQSLGFADFSNSVLNGQKMASNVWASSLLVGQRRTQFTPRTISFKDYYGNTRNFTVLAVASE